MLKNHYYAGVAAFNRSHFGGGVGHIFLDDVKCSGHEQYLVDCNHSPIGVHDCDHSEDAGVVCISLGLSHANTVCILNHHAAYL